MLKRIQIDAVGCRRRLRSSRGSLLALMMHCRRLATAPHVLLACQSPQDVCTPQPASRAPSAGGKPRYGPLPAGYTLYILIGAHLLPHHVLPLAYIVVQFEQLTSQWITEVGGVGPWPSV
jgi:hypothetical protein